MSYSFETSFYGYRDKDRNNMCFKISDLINMGRLIGKGLYDMGHLEEDKEKKRVYVYEQIQTNINNMNERRIKLAKEIS